MILNNYFGKGIFIFQPFFALDLFCASVIKIITGQFMRDDYNPRYGNFELSKFCIVVN
uniref:Uncharacterized protein n=1 Tax=Anguilla anguilla TaxID=7936 RepID=A0A0E9W070_ANGAN